MGKHTLQFIGEFFDEADKNGYLGSFEFAPSEQTDKDAEQVIQETPFDFRIQDLSETEDIRYSILYDGEEICYVWQSDLEASEIAKSCENK